MAGIIGVIAFLTVLGLSLVITRVATIALAMTGLSSETARFQARSAFTGTGFTTAEAEQVVSHPVRRRIIMWLMIFRSAGIVTIVLSLILSLGGSEASGHRAARLLWLLAGVLTLWLIARSKLIEVYLGRLIQRLLHDWTDLDTRDYASLLRLSGDYRIMELQIERGDWLADKSIASCKLRQEGVNILAVKRHNGDYVGVPHGQTTIRPDDVLILYGRAENLRELDKRRSDTAGDQAHDRAIDRQRQDKHIQDERDTKFTVRG